MAVLTLNEYRNKVRKLDWAPVYQELYPDYWQDFAYCTEQDYSNGEGARAFFVE